jgi:protein-S-isoprenylcysteine O-methyltransferase Ste14
MGPDVRVHPVPHESAVLRMNGVYAHIRHPMYASVLLGCLGVTLISGRLLAVVSTAAMAVVLNVKARFEDRLLREKFGLAYAEYARAVPSLLPRPWRSRRR